MRLLLLLVLAVVSTGCISPRSIDAGHEGVIVRYPTIFAWLVTDGVLPEPEQPGTTWRAWSTTVIPVDMRPGQWNIHVDDFMTSDGVPLDFDAVIRLRIVNSVRLISEFGEQWFERNVQQEFLNRLRQSVRQHGMNETAIETAAIEEIDQQVSDAMAEYIAGANLPVELIQVTVGRANPPDAVMTQRVETATQQQRQLTEQQRQLAEEQREAAERAAAIADNAYREGLGLTPAQFLIIEQYEMLREVCRAGGSCTLITGIDAAPVVPVGR